MEIKKRGLMWQVGSYGDMISIAEILVPNSAFHMAQLTRIAATPKKWRATPKNTEKNFLKVISCPRDPVRPIPCTLVSSFSPCGRKCHRRSKFMQTA
jgi:hypothetical protein